MLAEPDPERQVRLNARNSREGKERISAVLDIIRGASPRSSRRLPSCGTAFKRSTARTSALSPRALAEKKALQRGLTVDRAADILWTLNNPDVWHLLVGRRGWTPKQFEKWAADTACAQLLK